MDDFQALKYFVEDMRGTSSSNEKKVIMERFKDNEFILKCLEYTYNPYKRFGVTSKNVKRYDDDMKVDYTEISLFELLDSLINREITGHLAIRQIRIFIFSCNQEYWELIYQIIDKNLEIRFDVKLINKVIPGLIPEFNVALAYSYKEKLVDFENVEWFASRKLDGVRCLCRIEENGEVEFYSRTGIKFETLGVLKHSIETSHGNCGHVIDGEVCIVENGKEDFASIMKEIRRKNHTIEDPKLLVFDCLTLEEFDKGYSDVDLETRLMRFVSFPNSEILLQQLIQSKEELQELQKEALEKGYEGLILRKNTGYKGKRSNDLLKVKMFQDAEYIIEDVVFGEMRFLEDGKDVSRETLSAVMIKHKGFDVKVGSGFTKEEREEFYKYPERIIGKTITVKYFEETRNQKGEISLRFPTVKHLYSVEGRNV